MLDSMSIASAAMDGNQRVINTIANNLANINTTGYKKGRIEFSELVHAPELSVNSTVRPTGGVESSEVLRDFSLGDLKQTANPLHVAINGTGFFELVTEDGREIYSRRGDFTVDSEGYLVSQSGHYLSDMIKVPDQSDGLYIDSNGEVFAALDGEQEFLGSIRVVSFTNVNGLEAVGDGEYIATDATGYTELVDMSNSDDALIQGYLEVSNVKMVDELTTMVLAQQAYGLNSRVVKISDEILSMINNLTE